MGLPPAALVADEVVAGGWPRGPATLVVSGCLSSAAGDETPASEFWFACSPAARIREAASVEDSQQRIDELVLR